MMNLECKRYLSKKKTTMQEVMELILGQTIREIKEVFKASEKPLFDFPMRKIKTIGGM